MLENKTFDIVGFGLLVSRGAALTILVMRVF